MAEYEYNTTRWDDGSTPVKPTGKGWRLVSVVRRETPEENDRGEVVTHVGYWERTREADRG